MTQSPKSRRQVVLIVAAVMLLGPLLAVLSRRSTVSSTLPRGDCGYEIVQSYPHDPRAFTQGLIWHDGHLYESTGQRGQSRLRKVDLKSGRVVQEHALEDRYFAEGMTLLGGRIYQLTWTAGTGFIYDAKTFAETKRFRYEGEGWGLTHDGRRLIMSNGTSRLTFIDPETLKVTGSIIAKYTDPATGREVTLQHLNELEYVDGEVFANVWTRDVIARIDPGSGRVNGWIDLSSLKSRGGVVGGDVLNGIAYDPVGDRLFVTGKYWPKLFQIKLVPVPKQDRPR